MYFDQILLCSKDFVSLDGFLEDISDDEVRHRKSSSHRGLPSRRKPEKVTVNNQANVKFSLISGDVFFTNPGSKGAWLMQLSTSVVKRNNA